MGRMLSRYAMWGSRCFWMCRENVASDGGLCSEMTYVSISSLAGTHALHDFRPLPLKRSPAWLHNEHWSRQSCGWKSTSRAEEQQDADPLSKHRLSWEHLNEAARELGFAGSLIEPSSCFACWHRHRRLEQHHWHQQQQDPSWPLIQQLAWLTWANQQQRGSASPISAFPEEHDAQPLSYPFEPSLVPRHCEVECFPSSLCSLWCWQRACGRLQM